MTGKFTVGPSDPHPYNATVTEHPTRYADWKAPRSDCATLIWPDADELVLQTERNARALAGSSHVIVQNTPLPELRTQMRAYVGHDDARPLIATGHQTELYHPGVWIKLCLINALASRVNGIAYHIAVDTDAPKHLSLRWPSNLVPVTDDPDLASAQWSGLLQTPTPAHLRDIEATLRQAAKTWAFPSAVTEFISMLRPLLLEMPNLSNAITNATHQLDWSLGLRHSALLASPLWECPPYLAFVHHILARPDRFARDYNAALTVYRREHKLRSDALPMPNLVMTDDGCEVPFWLDDLSTGTRSRATVVHDGDAWSLRVADDRFVFHVDAPALDAAGALVRFLRRHNLRLSPRALTLTMFLRMLLADQFVHGIGGGRYDQVTDVVMQTHFGLEAPSFSVTTGTLYWPGAVGRERVCLECFAQEGHRLKHGVLGESKSGYLSQINHLPRGTLQRRLAFTDMHRKLASAAVDHPDILAWASRVQNAADQNEQDARLFDRELFYAFQPRHRLLDMVTSYRHAFGLSS